MRPFRTPTPVLLVLAGFAVMLAQPALGDSLKARFSSDADAVDFVVQAENMGQGNRATVTHNSDGSTSVQLPEVATEMMSEAALSAIEANAIAIELGPVIPVQVIAAIEVWFDGLQAEGNTEIALTGFTDGFEYSGNVTGSAIGFDRSYLEGNTFFAYLAWPTVVAEITALDPALEEPIKAAIEAEAASRGILIGTNP